ncbi:hypothetical protein FGO68_gene6035 [Halteria grandinella]|uniref:Mitochondrial carrier protein n=1 Tax=Halteria grandinella TaxID=5974 RepID=A0A8J8NCK9_HALGN|nr:hypothetical protein FGO68_gene6035 [Halteria grandinella]
MFKDVVQKEGIRTGLYKGYSASFYGSIMYGYIYFALYKGLKVYLKENLGNESAEGRSAGMKAAIYASASTVAEILALCIYYPFELIKVRFMTMNDKYKYYSVTDAMYKISTTDPKGPIGLYRGVLTFFFTFMGQYTLQMTAYELISERIKDKPKYDEHGLLIPVDIYRENMHVIQSSIMSGAIAALFTNFLEVIVFRQQSGNGQSVAQILKEEGFNIFTKGITAKLLLTSCSSILFFMSMHHIGKAFNTNLSEAE